MMKFQTDGREKTTSTRTRRFPDTRGSEQEESLTVHDFNQKEDLHEGSCKVRLRNIVFRGGANSGLQHKPCFRVNRVFQPFKIRVSE